MRVDISDAAEADLEEIGNFIAEDNPSRADGFVLELLDRCYGLAEYSARYPIVSRADGREVRRCPYNRYLIFYAVEGDELQIVRIVHTPATMSACSSPTTKPSAAASGPLPRPAAAQPPPPTAEHCIPRG